jgi:peptide/nickel transport system substrate-binding protein
VKKLILVTLTLILVIGMVLISCGKESSTTTTTPKPPATLSSTPPPASKPPSSIATSSPTVVPSSTTAPGGLGSLAKPAGGKDGGRLQLQAALNVNNVGDPAGTAGPSDALFSFPVVEPLVIIDKNNNISPWLAEEILPAADGSSLTLKLRKGISFTDGTPFNADAAKYNLDNGINSPMWPNMKKVKECVIVDPYTIRLDFVDGKWDWTAVKALAGFWSVMMFSPTALKNNTPEWKMTHVVGTGPFILKQYVRDQKLVYDRNDNYWRGKPYLDGIDWHIIPQTEVALLSYKAGELHTIIVQPKDAGGLIKEGFEITATTDIVLNMCILPSSAVTNSPLADIRVRRAVEYAIDKQELVDALTYGYGVVTNQEFCIPPYMDTSTVGYPYDLEKAKALLAETGYPNGIQIKAYQVDAMPDDLGLALQGQLKKAGIDLKIDKVGYSKFVNMIQGGEGWDGYVFSYGFPGTTVDPASTLGNGPLNSVRGADGNWMRTTWLSCDQPSEICDLFEKSNAERDSDKRKAIIQEISRKMIDDYCMWTFMYYTPTLTSKSPILKGDTVGQYIEFYVNTFAWLDD